MQIIIIEVYNIHNKIIKATDSHVLMQIKCRNCQ